MDIESLIGLHLTGESPYVEKFAPVLVKDSKFRDRQAERWLFKCISDKSINENERLKQTNTWIDIGQDVNIRNDNRETPLMCSVKVRSIGCVQFLLSAGCNVNLQDVNGGTALHQCFRGQFDANTEMIKTLLEAGADVNLKDNCGITSSYLSLISINKEAFDLIVVENGDLTQFRRADLLNLYRECEWKFWLMKCDIIIERLYMLNCPVYHCKDLTETLRSLKFLDETQPAFIDSITDSVPPLRKLCKFRIRKSLQEKANMKMKFQEIPQLLRNFILQGCD